MNYHYHIYNQCCCKEYEENDNDDCVSQCINRLASRGDVVENDSEHQNDDHDYRQSSIGDDFIILPISYRVYNVEMLAGARKVTLGNQIQDCDILQYLTAQLNKIWKPAKIVFQQKKCQIISDLSDEQEEAKQQVGNTNITNTEKWTYMNKIVKGYEHKHLMVYVLPHVGSDLEGHYWHRRDESFIGGVAVGTHLFSSDLNFFHEQLLVGQASQSTIAKVIAKYFGHIFGLINCNCEWSIMETRAEKRGFNLTKEHIRIARTNARKILHFINQSNP